MTEINPAAWWNEDHDQRLENEGLVDRDVFWKFADAHGYDAASTVQWLEWKLGILRARVATGKSLQCYETDTATVVIDDVAGFDAWCARHFPGTSVR